MSEIEWTHNSTRDWTGETNEGYEYFVYAHRIGGHGALFSNNVVRPYSTARLGLPDKGPGVMQRLADRCQQHYNDLRAGRTWQRRTEARWPKRGYLQPPGGAMTHPLTRANVALHNMEQRHRAEKDALLLGSGYLADVSESMVVCLDPALIRVTAQGTPTLTGDLADKLEARNIRRVPNPPELEQVTEDRPVPDTVLTWMTTERRMHAHEAQSSSEDTEGEAT